MATPRTAPPPCTATPDPNAPPERSMEAAWRHQAADWIMDFLASPASYQRRMEFAAARRLAKKDGNARISIIMEMMARRAPLSPAAEDMALEYAAHAFDKALARRGTNRDDWQAAMEAARSHILALIPGLSPVALANELADPSNAAVLRDLGRAGWLPIHPADAKRMPRDDAERMARAEAMAAEIVKADAAQPYQAGGSVVIHQAPPEPAPEPDPPAPESPADPEAILPPDEDAQPY